MFQGYLKVILQIAEGAAPVPGESVYIGTSGFTLGANHNFSSGITTDAEHYNYRLITDASGATQSVTIEAPDPEISLNQYETAMPYSVADIFVNVAGYYPVRILHAQIFADKLSVLPILLTPLSRGYVGTQNGVIVYVIPPNEILTDTPREHTYFPSEMAVNMIAERVVIPEYVSVHLGAPSAPAENVYVSFPDYIKNVASSEIFPTWHEETLRANIIAMISLTLNRIFTEWYPSQGYDFDITNSTQFDQSYVNGRNIFENVGRIVDEIFNTYVTRRGYINPLFTSYCDGRRTTCAGMSQWGSENLGMQGYSALNILKYYYGEDIELKTTDIISNFTESYPGYPLTIGSEGPEVEHIRRQLYRVSFNYPLIPRINPIYRTFDSALDSAVRTFQAIFGLDVDGIVGKATWYRLSYVYASIIKLAELTESGESGNVPVTPPTVEIGVGDSSRTVALAQFLLDYIGLFYPSITTVAIDGEFGAKTEQAVREFQELFGLPITGRVGEADWAKLYDVYLSILRIVTPTLGEQSYPGLPLRRGNSGENVLLMQEYLNRIAESYPAVPRITADGVFGPATETAVMAFQRRFFIPETGIIDAPTWEQIVAVYNFLQNEA